MSKEPASYIFKNICDNEPAPPPLVILCLSDNNMARQISVVAKASRRDWTAAWPNAHLLARNGGADINTALTNLGYKPEEGHSVTTVLSITDKGDISGSYFHWSGNVAGTIHVQDVFGSEAPPAVLQFEIPGDLIEFRGKDLSTDAPG